MIVKGTTPAYLGSGQRRRCSAARFFIQKAKIHLYVCGRWAKGGKGYQKTDNSHGYAPPSPME